MQISLIIFLTKREQQKSNYFLKKRSNKWDRAAIQKTPWNIVFTLPAEISWILHSPLSPPPGLHIFGSKAGIATFPGGFSFLFFSFSLRITFISIVFKTQLNACRNKNTQGTILPVFITSTKLGKDELVHRMITLKEILESHICLIIQEHYTL